MMTPEKFNRCLAEVCDDAIRENHPEMWKAIEHAYAEVVDALAAARGEVERLKAENRTLKHRDYKVTADKFHRHEFVRLMDGLAETLGVEEFKDWAKVEEYVGGLLEGIQRLKEAGEHYRSEWELATGNNERLTFQLREVRAQQVEDFQRAEKLKRDIESQKSDNEWLLVAIGNAAELTGDITFADMPRLVKEKVAEFKGAHPVDELIANLKAEIAELKGTNEYLETKVGILKARADAQPAAGSLEERVRRLEDRVFRAIH